MMNKRAIAEHGLSTRIGASSGKFTSINVIGLLLCGVFFLCGCIVGTISATMVSDTGSVSGYISGYASSAQDFLVSFFASAKYHLLAVFLGFSVLGIICLPVLSAVRGFFLCFSVASVVRAFPGQDGVLLALSIFGFSSVTMVPCYFVLAVQSFASSMTLFKSAVLSGRQFCASPFGKQFFLRITVCMLVLIFLSLIDTFLISRLVKFAAHIV